MEFAFGSAVSASKIVDGSHTAYQQTFYDNFEWGVLENALKWRMMEWTKVSNKISILLLITGSFQILSLKREESDI